MKEVNSNGLDHIVSQAIEEMKREQGDNFSPEKINLAELGRRTGLTRARLRKLKRDGFVVKPHGLLGRRFTTEPGEAFQMDWGFTNVVDYDGSEYQVACFAMICHHCGQRYVEFFPCSCFISSRACAIISCKPLLFSSFMLLLSLGCWRFPV